MDSTGEAVGYFRAAGDDSGQVRTLHDLRAILDGGEVAVQSENLPSMKTEFTDTIRDRLSKKATIDETRRRAALSAIEEECRQLLSEAAYIELAKAAQPDLFDDLPTPEFSPVVIQNLRRHGYPFRGALAAVSLAGLSPRSDDPLYLRILNRRRDALERRFEGIKAKLKDAPSRLVVARKATSASKDGVAQPTQIEVRVFGRPGATNSGS